MGAITGALIAGAAAIGGSAIAANGAKKQANAIQQSSDQATQLQREQYNQSRTDMLPWISAGTDALSEVRRRLGLPAYSGPTAMSGNTSGLTTDMTPLERFNLAMQQVRGGQASAGGVVAPNANNPLSGGNALATVGNAPEVAQSAPLAAGSETPQVLPTSVGPDGAPLTNMPTVTGTPQASNPLDPENRYGGFYASPGYQFRLDEGNRAITANRAASGMLQSGDTLRALTRYGQDYGSNEFNTQLNQLMAVAGLGQTSTGQSAQLGANFANNAAANALTAGQARSSAYGTQANAWGNALGSIGGIAYNWFGR